MDNSTSGMLFDLFFGAPEFWVPSLIVFIIVAALMLIVSFRNRVAALQRCQPPTDSSSAARSDTSISRSASKPKRSKKPRSVTFIVVTTTIVATVLSILTFIGTLAYYFHNLYLENM